MIPSEKFLFENLTLVTCRNLTAQFLVYIFLRCSEFLRDGFGEKPFFHVIVAELTAEEVPVQSTPNPDLLSSKMPHNEKIVGHALYFHTFSSWEGPVLYVEDLFVREEYRSELLVSNVLILCAVCCK